jgi:small-conductance mechanosensitive channel
MMDVLKPLLDVDKLLAGSKALLLVLAGFVVASLLGRLVRRVVSDRLELQRALLLRRAVFYAILFLFLVAALNQLGFQLGVLLGAAGVLSVAIGFASQTSVSNLISGLFLIGEAPFAIGDVIQVGGTTGEVLGIDLLAVKLRTFDNRFVRIPNETLIKTEVVTLTRFPIRRADLLVGVNYREDLEKVKHVLQQVADGNPLCLDEPKPLFIFQGFGESSMDIQFSVWAAQEDYLEMKNSVQFAIKRAFDAAGIEIPFPHRTLVTAEGRPLPIAVDNPRSEQEE